MEGLAEGPLISVVMPTYDTDPAHLRAAIGSVRAQRYPDWELCIVDDGSTRPETRRALEREAARDRRIRTRLLEENSGISSASNAALELAGGELVAFLDHDDELTEDALLRVAEEFSEHQFDLLYTDQDKLTSSGERTDPFLKPDWSPVYALGAMYVGHLLVARRELIARAGGFDPAFDTIQDFELLLRLTERTDRIRHLPQVLYHWRAIPGSIALGESEKPGVTRLQARAVSEHLCRRGIEAEAVPHPQIPHRLRLRPPPGRKTTSVSVVIAARERADRALAPLLERTAYPELEVIAVEPAWARPSAPPDGVSVVAAPDGAFHPAAWANAGAGRASGDYLLFLGEDTEVTEPDWVEQLLLYAGLPRVGAVGPVLTDPGGAVAAAGIAIGLYDPAVATMRGFASGADGYYGSLSCAREVSAVGAECLLIDRSPFEELGGFEQSYSRQFHDVDLCLRLAERGLTTICAPAPRTITHTADERRLGDFDVLDRALFVDRWYERLERGDPYYNRGFFRVAADYSLPPFAGDELELAMQEAAR